MCETTFTEPRNQAKNLFDAVEDIVPVKAAIPAWKKPPLVRLSLDGLSLGDEVVAGRRL